MYDDTEPMPLTTTPEGIPVYVPIEYLAADLLDLQENGAAEALTTASILGLTDDQERRLKSAVRREAIRRTAVRHEANRQRRRDIEHAM